MKALSVFLVLCVNNSKPEKHSPACLVQFHRRCFGLSNAEQGMSIEEGLVRSFNNQHSLFDIHDSNKPSSPVKLHQAQNENLPERVNTIRSTPRSLGLNARL